MIRSASIPPVQLSATASVSPRSSASRRRKPPAARRSMCRVGLRAAVRSGCRPRPAAIRPLPQFRQRARRWIWISDSAARMVVDRVRVPCVDRRDQLIEVGLGHTGNTIEARTDHHRRHQRLKRGEDLQLEHCLHLFRRTWQQHDHFAVAPNPLARRCAAIVGRISAPSITIA